jgi:hypothetical protein
MRRVSRVRQRRAGASPARTARENPRHARRKARFPKQTGARAAHGENGAQAFYHTDSCKKGSPGGENAARTEQFPSLHGAGKFPVRAAERTFSQTNRRKGGKKRKRIPG